MTDSYVNSIMSVLLRTIINFIAEQLFSNIHGMRQFSTLWFKTFYQIQLIVGNRLMAWHRCSRFNTAGIWTVYQRPVIHYL